TAIDAVIAVDIHVARLENRIGDGPGLDAHRVQVAQYDDPVWGGVEALDQLPGLYRVHHHEEPGGLNQLARHQLRAMPAEIDTEAARRADPVRGRRAAGRDESRRLNGDSRRKHEPQDCFGKRTPADITV